ncbi:MAG: putative S-layer protein, partial [Planctomycetota bacterium]
FTVDNINMEGAFTIELRNIQNTNAQIVLDDITWTNYAPAAPSTNICTFDGGVSTNPGDLEVKIKDISVIKGYGKDEEWLPLDEVEVEFEVKNKGDYDIKDISLEWGIADSDLNDDWLVEFDEVDSFKLKDGDKDTFTVTFKVDDKDLELDYDEFTGQDYQIVVRVTGELYGTQAEDDSVDGDESCASESSDVSIIDESDFVILDNIELYDMVSCGDNVQITADVWNIGTEDQEDVSVKIYNSALGINKIVTLGDIDSFEDASLNTVVEIPDDAEEGPYTLTFQVLDEDNDVYQNDYDDEDSDSAVLLTVEGGCGTTGESDLVMNAFLESGGKAGEDLLVKVTFLNTQDSSATYLLNAAGFSTWADSASLSPQTITLNAGSSGEVLVTLKVKSGVEGEKTFNMEVISDNQVVLTQPVTVTIQKSSLFSGLSTGGNWFIWVIGALNVILVIAIIIVVIRLLTR